jgi:hypothetical protein
LNIAVANVAVLIPFAALVAAVDQITPGAVFVILAEVTAEMSMACDPPDISVVMFTMLVEA